MTDDLSLTSLLAEVRAKKPELVVPAPPANTFDPVRRRWLAVMHLLGASFGQLAKMTGRRAQSINKSVEKEVPVEVRRGQRLDVTLTHTGIVWYTERFYERTAQLMQMTPAQAAAWLKESHPYTED